MSRRATEILSIIPHRILFIMSKLREINLANKPAAMHTLFMGSSIRAIAACPIGLEKVLAHDLAHLGYHDVGRSAGRVFFNVREQSLTEDLARANIGLRTADRVLLVVGEFKAFDFDGFYQGVFSIPWECFCTKETKVVIERVRLQYCVLHSQATLQSMAQKSIYASLMERFHIRTMPETGNTLEVRIYGDNNWWQIVVDTSGEALSKRGYRRLTHMAPLKETIAASMLFLAGWSRARPLIDPFCGSGTIAIEAALYACNVAPGLRRRFAFEFFPSIDSNKIEDVRIAFRGQARKDIRADIRASDIDKDALALARKNASIAGISEFVNFAQVDARNIVPLGSRGVLLANPPYGQRMGSADKALSLYKELGPILERFLEAGWDCGFLSSISSFGDAVGITPVSVREIVSGQEKIYFNWFSGTEGLKAQS